MADTNPREHDRDAAARARSVRAQLDAIENKVLAEQAITAPAPAPRAAAVGAAAAAIAAAPLVPRSEVQRATGTLRDPHKTVHWSDEVKAAVLAAPAPAAGPVVAVIVSMQCAVVGPFNSPDSARDWWSVEYNRLARVARLAIWPVPTPTSVEPVAQAATAAACATPQPVPVDDAGTLVATLAERYPDTTSRHQLARAVAAVLATAPPGADGEVTEVVDEAATIGPAQLAELLAGADPQVWVATNRRGIEYHRPEQNDVTGCQRTTRYGEILRRSEVIDRFGSKPCRRCYPDGDDTVPFVGDRYPIVLVRQEHGQPTRAEVRKARPGGRLVQVVYLHSRTGAWINAARIMEPPAG